MIQEGVSAWLDQGLGWRFHTWDQRLTSMFYSEGLRGREWLWLEKEPWRLRAEQRLWKKNEEAGKQGARGGVKPEARGW